MNIKNILKQIGLILACVTLVSCDDSSGDKKPSVSKNTDTEEKVERLDFAPDTIAGLTIRRNIINANISVFATMVVEDVTYTTFDNTNFIDIDKSGGGYLREGTYNYEKSGGRAARLTLITNDNGVLNEVILLFTFTSAKAGKYHEHYREDVDPHGSVDHEFLEGNFYIQQ